MKSWSSSLLLFLILLVEKFRLYFSQRSLVSHNCSITARQTSLFQASLEIRSFAREHDRMGIHLVWQRSAPRNGTAGACARHSSHAPAEGSPGSQHSRRGHQEPRHSNSSVVFNPPSRQALLQTRSLTNTGWFQPSLR